MRNTAPSAFDPSPLAAVTVTLLPAVLGFAPAIMVVTTPGTEPMSLIGFAAAIALSSGLSGLFYMMVRQQKQLQELRAQLTQNESQEDA